MADFVGDYNPSRMAQIASPLSSSDEQATAATDLVVRTIVSIAVCIVLSWQLTETVSSSRAAAKENISNDDAKGNSCCCCFSGNTTLQWFLLILMLFSVLEGLVGLFADLFLIGLVGDAVPVANVRAEISMSIALGRIGDAIISLMIMGLGVSSWSRHSAKVAVALGFASLVTRLLPAPLVLVAGVSCLQRTPKAAATTEDDAAPGCCPCCSLRCALRPLLALAMLETLYASLASRASHDERFVHMMHASQEMMLAQADESDRRAGRTEPDPTVQVLQIIHPQQLLELAQMQLGELVELGVVLALGLSGHRHGLKHVRLPIVAAFVPGLPTPFAVVFYFLLETRQTKGGGGTLLPLHGAAGREE